MLVLLPNLLDTESKEWELFLPAKTKEIVCGLDGLFCENEKEARHYLLRFMTREKMQTKTLRLFNEHSDKKSVDELVSLASEKNFGLLSDAGLSCLADPGAYLIFKLRKKKIPIQVISGPSSIYFALMLSGFSGQKFCFHGYLPKQTEELKRELLKCEKAANDSTQIWIERPYQTKKMVETLLEISHPSTYFCLAQALTTPLEQVWTFAIKEWKEKGLLKEVKNVPSVFLMAQKNEDF